MSTNNWIMPNLQNPLIFSLVKMMNSKKPRSLSQIGNRAMFPRKTFANNENEIVELRESLIDGGVFLEVPSEKLISVIKNTQDHINSLIKSQMCVEAKKYQVFLNNIQEEINNRVDKIENNPRKLPKTQNRNRDLSSLPKIQEIETEGKRNVEILSNRHEKLLKSFDDIWEYKIKRKYLEPSSKAKRIMAKAHGLKESKKNEEALQALEEYEKVINEERVEALEAYNRDYEEAKMKLIMKQEREKQAVMKEMKRKKYAIITSFEMTRASSSIIGNRTNSIKFARPGAVRKSGNKNNVKLINNNNPPKPLLPLNNPVDNDNDDSSINDHSSQYAYNVIDSHEYDSDGYEEDSNPHSGFDSMYVFPNDIENNNADNMSDNFKQLTNEDESLSDNLWISNDNHADPNSNNDEIRFDSHDKPVHGDVTNTHDEDPQIHFDGSHNNEVISPEQNIESNNRNDDQSVLNNDSVCFENKPKEQNESTTISSQNDVVLKILMDNDGQKVSSLDENNNMAIHENLENDRLNNNENRETGLSPKKDGNQVHIEEQNQKGNVSSLSYYEKDIDVSEIKPESNEGRKELDKNHDNDITSDSNQIEHTIISDKQQPEQFFDIKPELPEHSNDLFNNLTNDKADSDHYEQSLKPNNDPKEIGDVYALKLDINEYSRNPDDNESSTPENKMSYDENNSTSSIMNNKIEDISIYTSDGNLANPSKNNVNELIGEENSISKGDINGVEAESNKSNEGGAFKELNEPTSLTNNANNLMNSLFDNNDGINSSKIDEYDNNNTNTSKIDEFDNNDGIIPAKNDEYDNNTDIIPAKNDEYDNKNNIDISKNDEYDDDQDFKLDSKQDDFADTHNRNENWSDNGDPDFLNNDLSDDNGNHNEKDEPQSKNEPPLPSQNNESLTENLMNIGKSMFDDDFN